MAAFKKIHLRFSIFPQNIETFFSDDLYAGLKNFYKNKLVKHEPRTALDEEFKIELMKQFRLEIEKLSDFLNRDLVTLWEYNKV